MFSVTIKRWPPYCSDHKPKVFKTSEYFSFDEFEQREYSTSIGNISRLSCEYCKDSLEVHLPQFLRTCLSSIISFGSNRALLTFVKSIELLVRLNPYNAEILANNNILTVCLDLIPRVDTDKEHIIFRLVKSIGKYSFPIKSADAFFNMIKKTKERHKHLELIGSLVQNHITPDSYWRIKGYLLLLYIYI